MKQAFLYYVSGVELFQIEYL